MLRVMGFKGINHLYSKRPFLSLLAVNILFVVLVVTLLPFYYETNDDPAIIGIVSGAMKGGSDYHTVFMNSILGFALSRLYLLSVSVEWYTLFLVVLHIVSCVIISALIIKHYKKNFLKIAALVFLYTIEMRLLTKLQFTTTSGILATASLLLIFNNHNRTRVMGVVFFVLASLIRFESAMLVGLIFACSYPLYLCKYCFDRRQFVGLCVCVCVAVVCKWIDIKVYRQDPEWSYYYDYNKIRGKLNDNPNAWDGCNALPEGIDCESYKLLTWHFFPDPEILTLDVLEEIYNNVNKECSYHGIPSVRKLKNVPNQLLHYRWELLICLLLVCLIWPRSNEMKEKGCWLVLLFGIPSVIIYLSLDSIVKDRVMLCLLSPLVFVCCHMVNGNAQHIWEKSSIVMGLMLLSMSVYLAVSIASNNNTQRENSVQNTIDADIVVCDPRFMSVSPWQIRSAVYCEYGIGWLTKIPCAKELNYKELCDNDSVTIAVLTERFDSFREFMTCSIKKHYNIDVVPQIVEKNSLYTKFLLKSTEVNGG